MSPWLQTRLAAFRLYVGVGLLQSQLILLAVGLSVFFILLLLTGNSTFVITFVYTFFAGNIINALLSTATPLYKDQPFPRDWIVFIALLLPTAVFASTIGGIVVRMILGGSFHALLTLESGDVKFGTLICFIVGICVHLFSSNRRRLQAANSQLAQQVLYGRQELEARASELRDAYEIQSSLLPRTIPQIAGVEISCAWQPARTVSGDYFDVLVLSETRIAFCLADVSGKGMSAALITANMQATLRAFAPNETSPAHLCERLNQALCASLPTGRFVTLVYAILDRKRMTLTYELAGHNPPVLLRGPQHSPEILALPGTGPVLGILPIATFQDQIVQLQPGDRLLLSTDGITEAFDPQGEEFGEHRLIAAAQRAAPTAHAIRTEIMADVTRFAEGNFHDDASLVIVQIQP